MYLKTMSNIVTVTYYYYFYLFGEEAANHVQVVVFQLTREVPTYYTCCDQRLCLTSESTCACRPMEIHYSLSGKRPLT